MVGTLRKPRREDRGSSDVKEARVIVKTTHSLRRLLPFSAGSVGQLSHRTAISSVCSLDENDSNESPNAPANEELVNEPRDIAYTLSSESGTEAVHCPHREAQYLFEEGLEHSSHGRHEAALESLVQALSLSHGSDLQPRILWTLVSHHVTHLSSTEGDSEQYHRAEADTYLSVLKPYIQDLEDEWVEQEASPALLDFLQDHGQWATALRVARVVRPDDTALARIHFETATQMTSDKAIPHLREALFLCDEDSLKASILNTMVHAHSAEEAWGEALMCHGCFMEFLDTPLQLAQAHFDAAELLIAQGNYAAALDSLDHGLELIDGDLPLGGQILQAKAHIFYHQGRTVEALRIHEMLLKRVEHNPADTAKLYYTMGRICTKTGRYELALQYFNSELNVTRAALGKYHMEVSRILHELARIHDEFLSNYDEAVEHYQAALKVERHAKKVAPPEKKREISSQILETQRCIGRIHYKRGDFGMALRTSFANDDYEKIYVASA